jgi:hypothetical protein
MQLTKNRGRNPLIGGNGSVNILAPDSPGDSRQRPPRVVRVLRMLTRAASRRSLNICYTWNLGNRSCTHRLAIPLMAEAQHSGIDFAQIGPDAYAAAATADNVSRSAELVFAGRC